MSEEKTHGGRRSGAGKKKGSTYPSLLEKAIFSLPAPLWIFLTETAKEHGLQRARYIDRLVAAVLRDNVSFDLDSLQMNKNELSEFLRLSQGPLRTGYISMLKETWEAFDKILKEKGWPRSRLITEIILSQVIKPIDQRVKLDEIEQPKETKVHEGFISKTEFVNRVFNKGAFPSKLDIGKVFDAFCDCIHDALISGESINLPNVGRLSVEKRKARHSRNPRTGDPLYVPEGECVKFTPAFSIKDYFKQKHGSATKKFPE